MNLPNFFVNLFSPILLGQKRRSSLHPDKLMISTYKTRDYYPQITILEQTVSISYLKIVS